MATVRIFGSSTIGSSPRLRGTAPLNGTPMVQGIVARFIPAPAGNSIDIGGCWRSLERTVHPRACGEQTVTVLPIGPVAGAVHPRACGEQQGNT